MKRMFAALLLSPLAAPLAVPFVTGRVLAQDEPAARLAGRAATLPPLSNRAMPAAPTVHRLSIGPFTNAPLSNGPLSTLPPVGGTLPNGAVAVSPDELVPAPADSENGTEALVQRARRGEAEANYRLGLKYLAGEGVTRDLVEAFARIRLAAEAGHPRAVSLFYTLGAKLTADEHGQAYERSQKLRSAKH